MKLSTWVSTTAAVLIVTGCGGSDSNRITGLDGPEAAGVAADVGQGSAGSVTLRSASTAYTYAVQWRFFSGAACTGTAGSLLSFPAVTASGVTFQSIGWASMQVTASATSSTGMDFAQWSGTDGLSSTDPTICLAPPADAQVYTATYGQSVNTAPVLDAIGNQVADEGTTFAFTATASDAETAAQDLTFSMAGAPLDAVMTSSGEFAWLPAESEGPGVYTFDICVHDDAVPPLSDCETISVAVNEVNRAPILDPIADQVIDVGSMLNFVAVANDPDEPANSLRFSLSGAPAGAAIDPVTGVFSWTPDADGNVTFDVVVSDDGSPSLSTATPVAVAVHYPPPEITDLTPADGSVVLAGTAVDFTGRFTAPATLDEGSCRTTAEGTTQPDLEGSSGHGVGTCTSTIRFHDPGAYRVTYTLTDSNGMSDDMTVSIAAYDPAAGSVTADGWILSGAGSVAANSTVAGKAIFNFNSSYRNRATTPTGYVSLQLREAGLHFRGLRQEWLVIDSNYLSSTFRGTGYLAGEPGSFGYQVWLHQSEPGDPGSIRIRIWRGSDETDTIYDNGFDQPVGGGAVNITLTGRR